MKVIFIFAIVTMTAARSSDKDVEARISLLESVVHNLRNEIEQSNLQKFVPLEDLQAAKKKIADLEVKNLAIESTVSSLAEKIQRLESFHDIKVNSALRCNATFNKPIPDVTKKDENGRSPLHYAAQNSTADEVCLLLQNGADPNAKDQYGWTPLHFAANYNASAEVVHLLLDNGADPNSTTENGTVNAFFKSEYDALVAGVEIESHFKDITWNGWWNNLLLKVEPNTTPRGSNGWSPLHLAIESNSSVEVVRLLLEKGADPKLVTEDRLSPIDIAVRRSTVEVVRLLLQKGADPNTQISYGITPIHLACRYNPNPELIRVLLEKGADLHHKDVIGWASLHAVTEANANVDVMRLLLEKGADPNDRALDGWTPLHNVVVLNRNTDAIRLLLEKGADPNVKGGIYGKTPLHAVTEYTGDVDVLRLLLEKGADPNAKDNEGQTPLETANYSDVFTLLKEHGAG